MRITLKPVNGDTASNQAGATKASGQSFLDTLAQTSRDAATQSASTVAATKGSSSNTSDHGSEDQTPGQPMAASENGADDGQENSTAGISTPNSAAVNGGEQNQGAGSSHAASTIGRLASSAQSQSKSKVPQPAEKQVTDSTQQADDQDAAQQLVAVMPAITLSEFFAGRSMQSEAVSPHTPAVPTVPQSNASATEQTGSGGSDDSQSSAAASTPAASTDASLLSPAIAAELIEQSTFAVGSALSQSMALAKSDDSGTVTGKTSQFKSSGATFTANSIDTSSAKASAAQDAIAAVHTAQNANPLLQHALGDSSAAAPIAIKPLEATVTQTVPVSSHTGVVSAGQPHAAVSATDVPMKAQDSADAAAEQLERNGSAPTAGISTAQLIQSMSESEMRVGMHSAEFGDISIRTSVSQQQLTAQISVDHGELGSAISAHLPSLQSKLGSDFGLHASIEVNQFGGAATGGNGQSSQQNHKMTSQSAPLDSSPMQASDDRIALPGEWLEVQDLRLDIRA